MPRLFDKLRRRPRPTVSALAETAQKAGRRTSDMVAASLRTLSGTHKAQAAAPALVLATGVGVAFWWWTQWARGRAEVEGEKTVAPED